MYFDKGGMFQGKKWGWLCVCTSCGGVVWNLGCNGDQIHNSGRLLTRAYFLVIHELCNGQPKQCLCIERDNCDVIWRTTINGDEVFMDSCNTHGNVIVK